MTLVVDVPANECAVDGCESKKTKRGYCGKHYQRWRKYGTPNPQHMNKTQDERFWEKVEKGNSNDCWEWTAATRGGYGLFNVPPTTIGAHRYAYLFAHGEIPAGLVLDHKCRNKLCVNPAHLHAVSVSENGQNVKGSHSRSGVRNVWWDKVWNRWTGQVALGGKKVSIGHHKSLSAAADAAKQTRIQLFTNNRPDFEEDPS